MEFRKKLILFALGALLIGATGANAQRVTRGKKVLLRAPSTRYGASYYPSLKWRVTLGMAANTAPAIADLDLDGQSDLVFAAVENNAGVLYRLTDDGNVKWRVVLPARATAGVTLGDIDRDGTLDILVACGKTLLCFDARAREKWRFRTTEAINSFPTIADLENDGKSEVLFGANDNYLHVLSFKGVEKWKFRTKSWITGGVAVGDFNNDKKLEVVFGSLDFNIYCLDFKGKERWRYETEDWVQSAPCIADVDRDGGLDVVAASDDGNLYCLSRLGTLKWKARVTDPQHARSYPVVADFDGEGTRETLVALPNGSVQLFTAAGEQIWSSGVDGGVLGSPLVADMNGDGVQDILLATQSGNLVGLNIWGAQQWSFRVGQTIESTPVLADLDRDGKLEIYVANLMSSSRDSGFFSQYELSSKGGRTVWTALKGDPYRTGLTTNAGDYARALQRGADYATAWEPFGASVRPRTGVTAPRRLRVTALPLDDVRGNRDGALDPGETAIWKVQVANFGKGASYDSMLTVDLSSRLLKLDREKMYLGFVAPGATKTVVFRLTAPPLAKILELTNPDGTFRDVAEIEPSANDPKSVKPVAIKPRAKQPSRAQTARLQVMESGVQAAVAQARVFNVPPLPPVLRVARAQILDGVSKFTFGNGNGKLDAGETVILRVLLRNENYTTAQIATATLASGTRDVLPATPEAKMKQVVPLGGRQLDFSLRVAHQLAGKTATLKLSTYVKVAKLGAAPPHSETLKFPIGARGVDTAPPEIRLASPQNRIATTVSSRMMISGAILDSSGLASFRFDKYPVDLRRLKRGGPNQWRFAFARDLKVGENVFPISATDGAGNSTTQWVRVVRRPTASSVKPMAVKTMRGRRN